ncbi:gamma-glutamyl-gamma-aminobutyrate hydrolase family protein [Pseudomonas sp. AL03]|nr:gamma-glutamyl-gamma-aminobutyrate hydrolase family protein [Pseudomonas sp. AL03]MDI3271800.1 gamma-glutamyl-gamma-aminobutyrate hydrolase family protein [Pseudomonas sp. AL03]
MSRLPLIGVTICSKQIGLHAYHISGDRCVHAGAFISQGVPLTLPSPAVLLAPSDILDGLDCILFTRSPSNIEPFHCSGPANASGPAHDSARTTMLSLTRATALAGICARQLPWQSVSRDADASNNA